MSSFDMLLSWAFCWVMQWFMLDCCDAVMDELLMESEGIASVARARLLAQMSDAKRIGVIGRFIAISSGCFGLLAHSRFAAAISDAFHPQTLLAYALNGQPLPDRDAEAMAARVLICQRMVE